jgi:hypothetical protein
VTSTAANRSLDHLAPNLADRLFTPCRHAVRGCHVTVARNRTAR